MRAAVRFPKHLLPGLAGLVAALLLAGCQGDAGPTASRPEHAPKVYEIRHVQFVKFEAGADTPSRDELERLDAFLARFPDIASDRVSVAVPADDHAAARAAALLRHLRQLGIAAQIRRHNADNAQEGALVTVDHQVVALPACPDWTDIPGRNFSNDVSANLGCATATNFGLMLADPADLLHGRKAGAADGGVAAAAVERYRAGKTKWVGGDAQSGAKDGLPAAPGAATGSQ